MEVSMSKVRAMDPDATLPWCPECDEDLKEAERLTIFYNPLDMHKEADIADNQIKSVMKGRKSESRYLVNKSDVKRMILSINNWKNFFFPDNHPNKEIAGKAVPFSQENIRLLPPEIRSEFVGFLTGRDRDDEKDDGKDLGEATA